LTGIKAPLLPATMLPPVHAAGDLDGRQPISRHPVEQKEKDMVLRAALMAALVVGTLTPAIAQDNTSHGLTCVSVNALGTDGAKAFFFGYEAAFLDFLDPEGYQAASGPAEAVVAAPQGASDMAAACAASPGATVAQVLATIHGMEDPIDLKQHFLQQ
jgi:hypothetical protein